MNAKQFLALCREKYPKNRYKDWSIGLWSTVNLAQKRKLTDEKVREELPPTALCLLEIDLPMALATKLKQIRHDVGYANL